MLADLGQSGSFKVRLPRLDPGRPPEAVLLNTAGGLTGGDALDFDGEAGQGAHAVFTTQASERVYRSLGADARVRTALTAGDGARIDWLPQETILFDGARLSRTIDVELAADAILLAHESVVFGRTAMGETVRQGAFSDVWRIRRAGRLVHADALRVEGAVAERLSRPAALAGGRAMATVLYLAGDAECRLESVRDIAATVSPADGVVGASAWAGKLVVRAVADTGAGLRRAMQPILRNLQDGRPLPRVWSI